jgi:hypothetical protein
MATCAKCGSKKVNVLPCPVCGAGENKCRETRNAISDSRPPTN